MKQQILHRPSLNFFRFFHPACLVTLLLFAVNLASAQVIPAQLATAVRTLPLDLNQLTTVLSAAPNESSPAAKTNPLLLDLPMPGGGERTFRVVESPIMEAKFAALYPDFKTYAVQQADDPAVTGRISITPFGFNGVILSTEGLVLIRPLDLLDPVLHEVSLNDFSADAFICDTYTELINLSEPGGAKMTVTNGGTKRTYSLAIVGTGEFHNANGGSVAAASAVVTSSVNGIQAIYERELAVNFQLLTPFIYTNPATDPFTAGLDRTLEAAQAVEANFPGGNYDMGHVFHDQDEPPAALGSGGVAALTAVCNNAAEGTGFRKAAGWSSSFDNTSAGWIKLATHEFGHMFDMPHTFNGTGSNCTSNIDEDNAYEIASGNSIMSYNGICGAGQNIPDGGLADHYFHTSSLEKAVNYMNSQSCHTGTATGNSPPTVNANPCGGAYTIPISTPFRLTGSGSDTNGDPIYYSWEQYNEDGAGVTPTQGFIGATAAASSIAPLFRSYPPTTSPSRTFPVMSLVAANSYASDFEPLPTVARTLNFRLTGRDWKTGGGGIHCSPLAVTVSASGPFSVSAPNGGETLTAGSNTTVTWNVNGTNAFCNNVNIRLSTDGGLNFPYTLLSATANDGSQSVTIPAGVPNTSTARIMVECADNTCVVFFDISNGNFTITSDCNAAASNICPTAAMTLPAGDPGLNLGLTKHYGSTVTQNTFSITNASPTGPLANATLPGGTICQTAWQDEKYATFDLAVSTTGSYTFTNISGGQTIFSLFVAAGYNPAVPCSSTFLGSNSDGAISWGSSMTATLTACTVYKLVVWTLNGANGTPTITFSGAGTVYSSGAGPGANYSYTYVAVNTANSQITAVNASSDFSSLAAGAYLIYGASYYSGAGPNPPTVNPATWVGQTLSQILSGGGCVVFSTNFKPLTVTGGGGCTPPVVTAPTLTQPTCAVPTGTILVNATGGTFEYSVNGGTTWQASATFSGLAAGNYDIKVRFQADPTCMTTYAGNPVVLTAPTGCCTPPVVTAPTVTQPTCAASNGIIVVNATGGTFEYSVDNGTTWQASATFNGLPSGNYNIKVRFLADPTCMAAYSGNPVVLAGCCTTFPSTDVPKVISAVGEPTVTSILTIPVSGTITDVNVLNLDIDHTYIQDLVVKVKSPANTERTLLNNICGDFDNILINHDDESANGYGTIPCPPNGGTYQSFQSLSPFDGQELNGTWTLIIMDLVNQDGGTLQAWSLEVCYTPTCTPPVVNAPTVTQPTCAVPTGTIVVNATGGTFEYSVDNGTSWQASATFSGLAAGNYTIKVRFQADPTCMTAYSGNPVVLTAASGCCPTYVSTDVPKAISSSGMPTVTSTLNIAVSGIITDVNVVSLDIDHTYINDLRIKLKSPANTERILLNQICGNQDNILISFDDESANAYGSIPCPPNGGTYQPNQTLSPFDTENLNGVWTLTIEDLADGDGGTLQGWGLQICYNACPTTMAVNGMPIPNGTYEAQTIITSSGSVASGANVVFKAGTSIELQANFEVLLGALFEVLMVGCIP